MLNGYILELAQVHYEVVLTSLRIDPTTSSIDVIKLNSVWLRHVNYVTSTDHLIGFYQFVIRYLFRSGLHTIVHYCVREKIIEVLIQYQIRNRDWLSRTPFECHVVLYGVFLYQ